MAAPLYSTGALEGIHRLEAFLRESDPAAAAATFELVVRALEILEDHPYLGRPAGGDTRELVISRGRTGYVALYRYREDIDAALVLAIRHQRESGFEA